MTTPLSNCCNAPVNTIVYPEAIDDRFDYTSCQKCGMKCTLVRPIVNASSEKRFYLTKEEGNGLWNYVGDPLNPNTTLDAGLIKVDREEIKVDQFGAYVTRKPFVNASAVEGFKKKFTDDFIASLVKEEDISMTEEYHMQEALGWFLTHASALSDSTLREIVDGLEKIDLTWQERTSDSSSHDDSFEEGGEMMKKKLLDFIRQYIGK